MKLIIKAQDNRIINRRILFFCLVSIVFYIGSYSVETKAQGLIPNGKCALIIASRQTMNEVRGYVNKVKNKKYVTIYKSTNGWYAIALGFLNNYEKNYKIKELKKKGIIPGDSLCSNGKNYIEEVPIKHSTNSYSSSKNNSSNYLNNSSRRFRSKINKIQKGMSRNDVIKLFGSPQHRSVSNENGEVVSYCVNGKKGIDHKFIKIVLYSNVVSSFNEYTSYYNEYRGGSCSNDFKAVNWVYDDDKPDQTIKIINR